MKDPQLRACQDVRVSILSSESKAILAPGAVMARKCPCFTKGHFPAVSAALFRKTRHFRDPM